MSVPKEKLNELWKELEQLNEKEAEQAVVILEDFIKNKKTIKRTKPSDYIGALKHLDVDVEEECKKMRKEWDNRGWESIT
jgi:hypothetical protein